MYINRQINIKNCPNLEGHQKPKAVYTKGKMLN